MGAERGLQDSLTTYDIVVRLGKSWYLVGSNSRLGIYDACKSELVIPIKYFEYKKYPENSFVILRDYTDGRSALINYNTQKFREVDRFWWLGKYANNLLFLHELRTNGGRRRTMVVRADDLKIIVYPTDVTLIKTDLPNNFRAALKYFNDGFGIDDVAYYIDKDYNISVGANISTNEE